MLYTLYLVGGWVLRLLMIPVVARRHRPMVALAWLAPVFLFPWAGTLLYLWLGKHNLDRDVAGHREVRRRVRSDDRMRQQHRHEPRDIPERHRDLKRMAERLSTGRIGGFPVLADNGLALLAEPGAMVDRLVEDLERARSTAHLLFYLYADDPSGRRVAQALARARQRGVRCRLLVDGWMSRRMRHSLGPWLRDRGVELHPLLPVHPLRQPLARVDIRNHRKLAVIDGRVAYAGSDNLHDPGHALEQGIWHQLSVRLEGPAALQLQMLFVEDWHFATGEMLDGSEIFPEPVAAGPAAVQTVPAGPSYGANLLQHVLVQTLGEAQRRVMITTPYFVPDPPLEVALRTAALRGVRVDLLLPQRSDRRVADLAGRAFLQSLLDAGVRVHLHGSGVLHAKTLTADDEVALAGSANFDHRSLFLNYEVMLLVYGADFATRLREQQQRWLARCRTLDPEAWRRRPERRKWLEHTARLLSPVL